MRRGSRLATPNPAPTPSMDLFCPEALDAVVSAVSRGSKQVTVKPRGPRRSAFESSTQSLSMSSSGPSPHLRAQPTAHSYRSTGTLLPESNIVTALEFVYWIVCVVELSYAVVTIGNFDWYSAPGSPAVALLSLTTCYAAAVMCVRPYIAIALSWDIIDSDRKVLWTQYKKTWLLFDVATVIPLDLFALVGSTIAFRILNVVRCVRAIRIISLFKSANPLVPNRPIRRVVRLLSCAIWGHMVFACIWMIRYQAEYSSKGLNSYGVFITSLYWAVQTSTSVGFGDIVPAEGDWGGRLLGIIAMIVGVGAYSYFIGYLSASVMKEDQVEESVNHKKEKLNSMMKFFDVPWEIQKQAFSLYPRLVEASSVDYQDVLTVLPPFMQEQIAYYIRLKLITRVPMFRNAEPEITEHLTLQLEEELVAPNQYIMRTGETGQDMYFLAHGVVEVICEEGGEERQLALLRDGAWFGEIALLMDTTRTATIRTVTCCDLMVLSKATFLKIIRVYPKSKFAAYIRDEGQRRLSELESPLKKNSESDTELPSWLTHDGKRTRSNLSRALQHPPRGGNIGGTRTGVEGQRGHNIDPTGLPTSSFPMDDAVLVEDIKCD